MEKKKVHTLTSKTLREKSFMFFQDMRNDRKLCDVTFRVGEEHISAHRVIISAVIPYFRDIFSNQDTNEERSISMPPVESSALKYLIEFAYTYELTIDTNNVISLLSAACYLGVEEVSDACVYFLTDNLDPENVLKIRNVADELNCSELMKVTDSYISEYFDEVTQTNDFLQCSFGYVRELILKDTLNVSNEEKVFETVMKWTKSSMENRAPRLPELLLGVRMPLLEPEYLSNILKAEDLIRTSIPCRELLDEVRDYSYFPERRKEVQSKFSTEDRRPVRVFRRDRKEIIYRLESAIKFTVQSYDLTRPKWITRENTTLFINGGSTVELHQKIYFFYWGYALEYDSKKNAYKYIKNLPTPRIFTGATSLKDKIYVCGGKMGERATAVVECFDPKVNEWKKLKVMPTKRWCPSTAALGDCIYVLGGRGDCTVMDCVERYDTAKNAWDKMPKMLNGRCFSAAASLNDKIYVCGGRTVLSEAVCVATAEVFDPTTKRWSQISPMPTARREFNLLSSQMELYAVGGMDDKGKYLHVLDIYDPENNEWTSSISTDSEYFASGAVIICDDGNDDNGSDEDFKSCEVKKTPPAECKLQ